MARLSPNRCKLLRCFVSVQRARGAKEEEKLARIAEEGNPESQEDAKQRLLLDRATMNEATAVLYEEKFEQKPTPTVDPLSIAPGIVPDRFQKRDSCALSPSVVQW